MCAGHDTRRTDSVKLRVLVTLIDNNADLVTLLPNLGRLAHRHHVFRVENRLGFTNKRGKLGLIIVINLL